MSFLNIKEKSKILIGIFFLSLFIISFFQYKWFLEMDIYILKESLKFRSSELTQFFLGISLLGMTEIVIFLILLIIFYLYFKKKFIYLKAFLLSAVGSISVTMLMKIFIMRPRPSIDYGLALESTYSFPSGHATVAIGLYGFLTYCFYKKNKQQIYRISGLLVMICIIFLIGLSRLYLGVHFLSDVIVGYIIGGIFLILSVNYLKDKN